MYRIEFTCSLHRIFVVFQEYFSIAQRTVRVRHFEMLRLYCLLRNIHVPALERRSKTEVKNCPAVSQTLQDVLSSPSQHQ